MNGTILSDNSRWEKKERKDLVFSSDKENELFNSTAYSIDSKPPIPFIDCCIDFLAYIQYCWMFQRVKCLLRLALVFFVTLTVIGIIEIYKDNPNQFSHEYAAIKSPSTVLKLGDIHHWCLDGKDDTCGKCSDPTLPISRVEYSGWKLAFMWNVKLSKDFIAKTGMSQPDVIFLGDSFIEATTGTFNKGLEQGLLAGSPAAQELDRIKALYDKTFTKTNGGKYDGLSLGIAGDTSPNVLWRIKQHEMRTFTPKVWWLAVGRNDMFRTKCSEEVTLMGIIRVVEELMNRNDGATIVINSLLPMSPGKTLQVEGHWFTDDMCKSIQEVNRQLKDFAKKHSHVVFFNADETLVEARGKSKYIIKKYYADKMHPSYEGYKALVNAQAVLLDTVMENREKKANGQLNQQQKEQKPSASNTVDNDVELKKEGYEDKAVSAEGEDDHLDEYDDAKIKHQELKEDHQEKLLLSVPFYIYDEFDWLSNTSNATIGNHTFAEVAKMSAGLGGDMEDFEILFYLSAIKHPMRVSSPDDAKLFILPMISVYIGWYAVYGSEDKSLCNHNICNEKLLEYANDVLEGSKWFQKSNGADHIATFTSFKWGSERFTKSLRPYPNLRRCNAILPENGHKMSIRTGKALIDNDRISFNMMYVADGCSPITFTSKTNDFALAATLTRKGRRLNAFFQDRRNICKWAQNTNFTSKYSMSVCGRGVQCPALSEARMGFHTRGDSFSASRLFHLLLSGTVPIFTLEEQLGAHQSFIDWMKLSYFIQLGADANETSFLHQLDAITDDKGLMEEKTKLIFENRDLFDWTTLVPFDTYMYMFQSHIYPETRASYSKYSALILPPMHIRENSTQQE